MQGSFCLQVTTPEATGWSVSVSPVTVNLDGVPEEYHDFADVFSKTKAGVLADHHPYDLKITLEEGASPPPSDPSICYLRKNYSPFVSSFTKTQPWDSFVPHGLPTERLYSLYGRRMARCAYVATSEGSTGYQRKTGTRSR